MGVIVLKNERIDATIKYPATLATALFTAIFPSSTLFFVYTMTNTLQMTWILTKVNDTKTRLAAVPLNMGVDELAVQNPLLCSIPNTPT